MNQNKFDIKAVAGLGNPGPAYFFTPHNIGFLILDQLAREQDAAWTEKNNMLVTSISINGHELMLIKPQTFMNNSGDILSHLGKRGIQLENILVVHDEIDFPFGKISVKDGGSARGHNGLRSLIACGGQSFARVRVGVGRPENPAEVGNFVTKKFQETPEQVQELIQKSIDAIKKFLPQQS